ncbi:MAG: UDP-N-acetylmuramate dehydrogenase [Paracoccaceae bacterium]
MTDQIYQLNNINIRLPEVRGIIRKNFELSRLSWLKVGGPASVFFQPEDEDDLSFFLRNLESSIPVFIIGACSNLIIRDGGIPGIVIKLGKNFSNIRYNENNISVGAACRDSYLAKSCAKKGIDFSFLRTIPGNLGGAVKMNAGCYGSYLSDYLIGLTLIRRDGSIIDLKASDLKFDYRDSTVPDDAIVTNVLLRKEYDDPLKIEKKMTKALDMRNLSQPIKDLSCGSTFRNPLGRSSLGKKCDNDHSLKAWKLIDDAGLRGLKLGGAMISKKHTNFLINIGNATAKDLEDLGNLVIKKVKKNSGIELLWEVKRVGTY